MQNYLVGFKVESSLNSHIKDVAFELSGDQVQIVFPDGEHPGEIDCFVRVSAKNHNDAYILAHDKLGSVLDSIAFVMKSSLFISRVFLILKDESGQGERIVFRLISNEKINGLFLEKNTYKSISEVLEKMEKASDFDLSLNWLRFAYRSRSLLEQFMYFWLAFERLIGESEIRPICKKCGGNPEHKICGALFSHPGIDKNRAKELLQKNNSNIDDSGFEIIWKIRQVLFHGMKKADISLLTEIREKAPMIGVAVENILEQKYRPSKRMRVERPVYYKQVTNYQNYYKFKTTQIDSPFPNDYPPDNQVREFMDDASVVSPYGFEHVEANDVKDW